MQELIASSLAEDAAYLLKLREFTGRMDEADRKMLLGVVQAMAKRGGKRD